MLLGRPEVVVTCDPQARPRRPRYVMSVVRPDQSDATKHRPAGQRDDVTPLMARERARARAMDVTAPLCELQALVDGKVAGRVRAPGGPP